MDNGVFPVIDPAATGENIRRLRIERGLTVRDLQRYFGFEEPRAIYKWQKGECLPSVDNLYALGSLLDVPMDQILVPMAIKLRICEEQQATACCSVFWTGYFGYGKSPMQLQPFVPLPPPAFGQVLRPALFAGKLYEERKTMINSLLIRSTSVLPL